MNEIRVPRQLPVEGIDALTAELLTAGGSRDRHPTNWVMLDGTAIAVCWGIMSEAMAHSCRDLIASYLFKSPFRISSSDGKQLHLKPEYSDEFERHYKAFAKDFLDCMMVMGVVPVSIVQTDSGHYFPYVPAADSYAIQMAYVAETERRYYRTWRPKPFSVRHSGTDDYSKAGMLFGGIGGREPGGRAFAGLGGSITDAMMSFGSHCHNFSMVSEQWYVDYNVYIIDGLGYDPRVSGSLTSPLASIIPNILFNNTLTENLLTAENKALHPYYVLQHHKNVDEGEKEEGKLREQRIPVFSTRESMKIVEEKERLTQEALIAFNHQLKVLDDVPSASHTSESHARSQPQYRYDRSATIPKGLEYVNVNNPWHHIGSKHAQQQEALDDTISRAFGVPLSMVKVAGNLRGFHDAFRENFRNRLYELGAIVSRHITIIFNQIYAPDDGIFTALMNRRKPVIDDTHFTDFPRRKTGMYGGKLEIDRNTDLAPPEDVSSIFKESVKVRKQADQMDDKRKKVADLKKKNKEFKDRATEEGPSDEHGASRRYKNANAKKGSFLIDIPTIIHADAKMVKHAYDIGAIDLRDYQEFIRFKIGIGHIPFESDPQFVENVVEAAMRVTGSEPGRVDSQKPESEDLGTTSSSHKREMAPSTGGLAEAVKKRKLNPKVAKAAATQEKLPDKSKDKKKD